MSSSVSASRDAALARIMEPVAPALAEVEHRLETLVPPEIGGLIPLVYQHVLKAGGKRVRPLLTLLSCQAAGGDAETALPLAAAVEVLHLSSLIHDDVIDQAQERRGRPSARQRWGNRVSILVGDFLVAEVFRRLADDLGRQTLTVLAQSVAEMCQAELTEQVAGPSEEDYFCMISGKTASLMAAACEVGAMAADNDAAAEPLHLYGQRLGEAFQIADDLLDLYGDPDILGKPVLQDLREGYVTLPVIHALQVAPPEQAALLQELIDRALEDETAARQVAELAESLGGRAYAEERARQLIAQARSALAPIPASPSRESLDLLADYVLSRRQ